MYFLRTLLVIAIWTVVIMDTWSQQAINRRNLRNRTRYNEEIIRNFYDTMTTDYDIDDRLNTSVLEILDNALSGIIQKVDLHHNRDMKAIVKKLDWLDVSFKRMKSYNRNCNIILNGLRFTPDWEQICEQLKHLSRHLGIEFDERHISAYQISQIPNMPQFSRLMLTFKKVTVKQLYMLKFKQKLEEYEKQQQISPDVRKLALVPGLKDCRIFLLDDIDADQKKLLKSLKSLQRVYPNYFQCYVKDSRVYIKVFDVPRPTMVDRQEDIVLLERRLYMLKQNMKEVDERTKHFRSGTVFSHDEYEYNRTRKTKSIYYTTLNTPYTSFG